MNALAKINTSTHMAELFEMCRMLFLVSSFFFASHSRTPLFCCCTYDVWTGGVCECVCAPLSNADEKYIRMYVCIGVACRFSFLFFFLLHMAASHEWMEDANGRFTYTEANKPSNCQRVSTILPHQYHPTKVVYTNRASVFCDDCTSGWISQFSSKTGM